MHTTLAKHLNRNIYQSKPKVDNCQQINIERAFAIEFRAFVAYVLFQCSSSIIDPLINCVERERPLKMKTKAKSNKHLLMAHFHLQAFFFWFEIECSIDANILLYIVCGWMWSESRMVSVLDVVWEQGINWRYMLGKREYR